jgi:hypothetical protein
MKTNINLSLLVLSSLTGCMTASDYRNTPSSKLCIDYLTLPSMNFNHPARAEELNRRGENCAAYAGAAAQRRAADDAFERSLQNMQNNSANRPVASNLPQGTHTIIKDGRVMMCTTTGNVTQCN